MRQVAQVDEAGVGFFEKGVAPSIDQAMANDSPEHELEVTSVVHLLSPSAGYTEETADDLDPHFWQDPSLMATAARAFATTMADADPAHAAYYRKRGAHLAGQLHRLDRDYARTSPPAGSARSWSATTPSSTSAAATTSTSSRSPASSPTPSRRCSASTTFPP